MPNPAPKGERKRTTFRLPKALVRAIKLEAADTDREMTDIIVEQLSKRYPDQPLFFGNSTEASVHASEVAQPA